MTDTESDVHRSSVTYPRAFVRRVASVTRARPAGGPVTEADRTASRQQLCATCAS